MTTPEHAHLRDEDLPPALRELKRLIGLPGAVLLSEYYGGLEVRIPSRFDPEHELVRVLGEERALLLIQHYQGDKIYVPKADAMVRIWRNIDISQRFEGGTPAYRLAKEYRLCERQVWNILKRPETLRASRPDQRGLFD